MGNSPLVCSSNVNDNEINPEENETNLFNKVHFKKRIQPNVNAIQITRTKIMKWRNLNKYYPNLTDLTINNLTIEINWDEYDEIDELKLNLVNFTFNSD